MAQFVLDVNLQIQKVLGLEEVKAQLASVAGSTAGITVGSPQGLNQLTSSLTTMQAASTAAGVNLKQFTVSSNQATGALKIAGSTAAVAGGLFDNYGTRVALAGARYSAFLAATAIPFAGLAALGAATQSIIEFDAAMVKLSQILQQPQADIDALREKILQLSTATGTSIKEISGAASILAQAGLLKGAEDFTKFLEPLSKIPLLPTFKNIEEATEGVIAALGQFGKAGLEPIEILDKLTRVADKFAVESADLNTALQIAGGTFAQLGGNIDEFLAIFTTIRQTTRESASSIATALKMIATRLAQPTTIGFLEGIGVSVRDQKGELLGLLDVFKNVQEVFEASGKEQQAVIGTALGGVRHVGRVFAGLRNTELTQEVLTASQTATGAVAQSAEKAMEKLSVQIDILKAKFIELAQSLAEPVFAPIIKSALAAGEAFIFVIDALKPVLPLLVQLTALGVGLKVFSFAASSIGSLAKALAAVNLGGLAGLGKNGAGGAGAQGVLPFAQPTAGQQAKNLAGSQVGQLGILLGINLAASHLASAFEKTDGSVTKLGLQAAGTATALLALASLASGRSVSGLFTALGPAAGVGLGVGVAAAAGLTAVATQTEIDINELVQKAAKKINELKIEITPGNEQQFQEATNKLFEPIGEAFAGLAEEFDPSTFSGFMNRVAKNFSKIISLDFSGIFDLSALTGKEVEKLVKEMFGTSGISGSKLLTEAINEFGLDFSEGLESKLQKALAPFAGMGFNVQKLVDTARKQITEGAGGIKGIINLKEQADKEAANRAVIASTQKIANDLKSIVIPQQIGGELKNLAEAIQRTVSSIDNSVSVFQSLTSGLGKIETPKIPTTFTGEAVRKSLAGATPETFGGEFPNLSKATQQVLQVNQAIKDFTTSFEIELGKVSEELGGAKVDASTLFEPFLKEFLANTKDLPPEARGALEKAGAEIAAKMTEATASGEFGLKSEEALEIIKRGFGNLSTISDTMVEEAKKFFEASARLINTQNAALDIRRNILQESSLPQTQLENLEANLRDLGYTVLPMNSAVGDAADGFASFGTDIQLAENLLEQYGVALKAEGEALAKLSDISTEDASGRLKAIGIYQVATANVRDLESAIAGVGKAAEAAKGLSIEGEDPGIKQDRQNLADIVKDIVTTFAKLKQISVAEDTSRIFVSAQERFSTSVDLLGTHLVTLTTTQTQTLADIQSMANVIKSGKFLPEPTFAEGAKETAVGSRIDKMAAEANRIFQKQFEGVMWALPTPKQAKANTFDQLRQQNITNPENPFAPFGTTGTELNKNIKLTIDPADENKLLLKLSPEAQQLIEKLIQIPAAPISLPPPPLAGLPPLFPEPSPFPGADLGVPIVGLDEASKTFLEGSNIFTGAIDQLINATIPLQNVADATQNNDQQAVTENNTFLQDISNKIAELVASIQSNLELQQEIATTTEEKDPTNELLASSVEATAQNTEVLAGVTTASADLSAQLSQTADAIQQGVGVKVEAIQNVNIDIQGEAAAIEGVGERLADIARIIARDVVNQALDQLAASAGDTETSNAFNSAKV